MSHLKNDKLQEALMASAVANSYNFDMLDEERVRSLPKHVLTTIDPTEVEVAWHALSENRVLPKLGKYLIEVERNSKRRLCTLLKKISLDELNEIASVIVSEGHEIDSLSKPAVKAASEKVHLASFKLKKYQQDKAESTQTEKIMGYREDV